MNTDIRKMTHQLRTFLAHGNALLSAINAELNNESQIISDHPKKDMDQAIKNLNQCWDNLKEKLNFE